MKGEIPSLDDCVRQIKEDKRCTYYLRRLHGLSGAIRYGSLIWNTGPTDFDPLQEAKDLIAEMEKQNERK